MQPIQIRPVVTRQEKRRFVAFANELYKDCPYYCPPLFFDEMNTFDPKSNPSLEVCDIQLWMAYRCGQAVGRIAACINHIANSHWNVKKVRFGWMDFVDDLEVSKALLDTVAAWGRKRGMTVMNGPVGMTDWDHEGLLIEGYEYLAPMASLYNFPYYVRHMEAYGLSKEVDWIEYQITVPDIMPERVVRLAQIVEERSHLRIDNVRSSKELSRKYGLQFMDVLDEAYHQLYNFQPMTQRQKEHYRDMYFPLVNFDFVGIVVNEADEVVGVGVGMPDISKALRRCGGKLFPLGWWHLLRAIRSKHFDTFDLLLIAVRPDYLDKGVTSLIFKKVIPSLQRYGVRKVETTSMLESNHKILATFAGYEHKQHKRRRAYVKDIVSPSF